jgi:hypothetical protein
VQPVTGEVTEFTIVVMEEAIADGSSSTCLFFVDLGTDQGEWRWRKQEQQLLNPEQRRERFSLFVHDSRWRLWLSHAQQAL